MLLKNNKNGTKVGYYKKNVWTGDWVLKHKIQDAISKSIEGKIDEVANGWAEKIVKNLEK